MMAAAPTKPKPEFSAGYDKALEAFRQIADQEVKVQERTGDVVKKGKISED
jgi:hypothetical protein